MDSRVEPLAMLGLVPGDAKILRNAGGRVTPDVLRSLVFATAFLGVTYIAIMQHTNCALAKLTDSDVFVHLQSSRLEADSESYLTMSDPDAALRSDVEIVKSSRSLPPGIVVEGWRYDVDTGLIGRIVS